MFIPALLIGGLLLMAGGGGKKRRRPTPAPGPNGGPGPREPTAEEAEAITFCEMEGGEATVMQTPDGTVYYVCTFPDGTAVEALAFHRGDAVPTCPTEMLWDPETQTCVLPSGVVCPEGSHWDETEGACVTIGTAWPPVPDDPNFEICMGSVLAAWSPFTLDNYNLAPAVAENVYLLMSQAVEEGWVGYETPEALADFGMVHVAPECDLPALRAYAQQYQAEFGMPPGAPEDLARVREVYDSLVALAEEVIAVTGNGSWDPYVEPDPTHGLGGQYQDDPGLKPDHGGINPICPPNYFYDALHEVCCPDGWHWNTDEQMCRPPGYSGLGFGGRGIESGYLGRGKKPQGDTKAHRVDMIRNGFAGGCSPCKDGYRVCCPPGGSCSLDSCRSLGSRVSKTGRGRGRSVMIAGDAVRHGYAGKCRSGRRGHCGVRPRS